MQRARYRRLGPLVRTKRGRRIGAASASAVIVAVAVLVILGSGAGTRPPDPYTIAAQRLCKAAERKVVQIERRHQGGPNRTNPGANVQPLVPIVGGLHAQLGHLVPPADRIRDAVELEDAFLETEVQLIHLIQSSAKDGEERALVKRVDAVSARVEHAAASLGLAPCTRVATGISLEAG